LKNNANTSLLIDKLIISFERSKQW
jgi:hypothetical protein